VTMAIADGAGSLDQPDVRRRKDGTVDPCPFFVVSNLARQARCKFAALSSNYAVNYIFTDVNAV
jgi:hypothetical protein